MDSHRTCRFKKVDKHTDEVEHVHIPIQSHLPVHTKESQASVKHAT